MAREDSNNDKPKRVKECPWCGGGRSSSQAVDGYCDELCRELYRHYLALYQSEHYGRNRHRDRPAA